MFFNPVCVGFTNCLLSLSAVLCFTFYVVVFLVVCPHRWVDNNNNNTTKIVIIPLYSVTNVMFLRLVSH